MAGADAEEVRIRPETAEPSDPVPQRLTALRDDVRLLLIEHRPEVVAIERVLFQVNVRTAIPVAQAAGVVMVEAVNSFQ